MTGVLVIMALQFLTPYFFYIPKAALASVIVCAVIFTVDFGILRPMWRSKREFFIFDFDYELICSHFVFFRNGYSSLGCDVPRESLSGTGIRNSDWFLDQSPIPTLLRSSSWRQSE